MVMAMRGLISEGDYREVQLDDSTHSLKTISYEHSEAHDGNLFSIMKSVEDMGALTTPDDTLHLHWTVGAGSNQHLMWSVSAGGAARLLVTLNPTGGLASPEGTLVPDNHRPGSSNVSSTALFYFNGTAPTGGTVKWDEYFGVTGVGGRIIASGHSRGSEERIIPPGSIVSMQLICSANVYGTIELVWYEHTDKETIS